MFELRMLVPGRPVAVGELQRGPTAFSGKIETQKKTNKSIKVLPAKQYLIIFAMKVEEKCDANAGLAAVNLIKSLVIEQEELHRFSQIVLVFIPPIPQSPPIQFSFTLNRDSARMTNSSLVDV